MSVGCSCLYPVTQMAVSRYIVNCMACVAPKAPAAALIEKEISSDENEVKRISRDPRIYHGQVMNRTAAEVLKLTDIAAKELLTLKVPFLALHGGDDKICYAEGSRRLFEQSATDPSKKSLVLLPGCRHEIFHEAAPAAKDNTQLVVEYFDSQLLTHPAGGADMREVELKST